MDTNNYLAHHGILGQKWGVRRYQNLDGSYTDAGKSRYGKRLTKEKKKQQKQFYKEISGDSTWIGVTNRLRESKDLKKAVNKAKENPEFQSHINNAKKATTILDKFEELPYKESQKYFDDRRIMDYQGAFKLYLQDTKQYDQYLSSLASIKEVRKFGKDIATDLLGKYGNKRIQYGKTMSSQIENAIEHVLKMPDTYFDDIDDDQWIFDLPKNN